MEDPTWWLHEEGFSLVPPMQPSGLLTVRDTYGKEQRLCVCTGCSRQVTSLTVTSQKMQNRWESRFYFDSLVDRLQVH